MTINLRVWLGVLTIWAFVGVGGGKALQNTHEDVTDDDETFDLIQTGYFYRMPDNITIDEMLEMTVLILSRGDIYSPRNGHTLDSITLDNDYQGLLIQYLRGEAIEGPPDLPNVDAGLCTQEQIEVEPSTNQATSRPGEFCELHDAIVTSTPIDHDLNPETPEVVPTEGWLLHNPDGIRIGTRVKHWDGIETFYYHFNPGVPEMREYFIARVYREMAGDDIMPLTGMDGIFLDNIELSWVKKVEHTGVYGHPREYENEEQYLADVITLVEETHAALSENGYPLWANLIEGYYEGDDWTPFHDSLDGIMLENFAHSWEGPLWPERIMKQFELIDEWVAADNDVLLVSQGEDDPDQARFSLAAYLMVAEGERVIFRHATSYNYREFWQYPEYDYALGRPLEERQLVQNNEDVIFVRYFECGFARVNLTQAVGEIIQTACAVPD